MSSITIKPVVYAQYKRNDGTFPVRMRVTFNRTSRYITTNLSARADQLTRGCNIKDAALLAKAEMLAREMREVAGELNYYALTVMDVDAVVAYIVKGGEGRTFALDFPTYASRLIGKAGAGWRNYRCALNALTRYVGREHYDISTITSPFLNRWQAWLEERYGKGARAVSMYTNAVAYIHKRAQREYNDEDAGVIRIRNPFASYSCPRQAQGSHRNVPPAIIGVMLLERERLTGRERLAVDVFLLSFALMGCNLPDLYECTIAGETVHYCRHKTRERREDSAEMYVRIEPCVRPLVEEYLAADRKSFIFAQRYARWQNLSQAVIYGLHAFAEREGFDGLTLYQCRHTWATVARSHICNIDKATVNDCICHVDPAMRVTDIYAQKDWRVMWEANAIVQKNFPWGLARVK